MTTCGRVPVTVLTGFLGAGKTTLLNRILAGRDGQRYGVIVNEFGELGIDGELIVGADEQVIELSNGCVCCALRGDLVDSVNLVLSRNAGLDGIIVETTGLAAPGPIAQTLMIDQQMRRKVRLDAVVTVVDVKHFLLCHGENVEVNDQIAFADVIILNKVDLVSEDAYKIVKNYVKSINSSADLYGSAHAAVDPDLLFGRRAFDFKYVSPEGRGSNGGLVSHHGTGVGAVSLVADAPLDTDRFHRWMPTLLARRQPDLLRAKGILDLKGEDQRYAFQAVQTISGGDFIGPWPGNQKRCSRLVLIGRGLEKRELQRSFEACVSRHSLRHEGAATSKFQRSADEVDLVDAAPLQRRTGSYRRTRSVGR